MNKYLMFIDTETSGIPRRWNAPASKTHKWPYILQISWVIYTRDGEKVKSENFYIKTGEISINKQAYRIHGISLEMLEEKGVERKTVIGKLAGDFSKYNPLVVAHYMEFDKRMLDVGFHRAGMDSVIASLDKFCTMQLTGNLHLLQGHNHSFMRLSELNEYLFNKEQENPHDALNDAETTAACFFEMKQRGMISDEVIALQQLENKKRAQKAPIGKKTLTAAAIVVLLAIIAAMVYFLNMKTF